MCDDPCIHHWRIADQNGDPTRPMNCKKCGAVKEARMAHVMDWADLSLRKASELINRNNQAKRQMRQPRSFTPKPKPAPKPRQEARHGTRYRYLNHGCRCEPCVDANRAVIQRMREKKRLSLAEQVEVMDRVAGERKAS